MGGFRAEIFFGKRPPISLKPLKPSKSERVQGCFGISDVALCDDHHTALPLLFPRVDADTLPTARSLLHRSLLGKARGRECDALARSTCELVHMAGVA